MIYIVEEDAGILEMESVSLKSNGYAVKDFMSTNHFFNECSKELPDLLIVDSLLINKEFFINLSKIKEEHKIKKLPVIINLKENQSEEIKALDFKADDYITIPFGIMEFISRVDVALCEKINKPEIIHNIGNITLDDEKHTVTVNNNPCELTYKEYELLKYLIKNKGIELTRDEIIENVWGTNFKNNSRTVDMHIKTLRQKLGESGALIKTVRNVGYKIE